MLGGIVAAPRAGSRGRRRGREPGRGGIEGMKFIGVDIGGTFTDVVFADTESSDIRIHKVPTTPDDPSLGMLASVRELCERENLSPGEVDHLFHGTTIATNAVLTHDGARTGMITSEGYRDILHIGPPPAAPALLDPAGDPVAGPPLRPPPPPPHGARAHHPARGRGPHPPRRGRGSPRRPPAPDRRCRVGRGLLPLLLGRPRPRGAGGRDRPRGAPGVLRHHLGRRLAPVPGVRAVHGPPR